MMNHIRDDFGVCEVIDLISQDYKFITIEDKPTKTDIYKHIPLRIIATFDQPLTYGTFEDTVLFNKGHYI